MIVLKANQLIVQDTAGNVRRIYDTIKDLEPRPAAGEKRKSG
jgi:hypothetical protein